MEGKFKMQAFSNLTLVGRNSRAKSIDCYNSKVLWKAHIDYGKLTLKLKRDGYSNFAKILGS